MKQPHMKQKNTIKKIVATLILALMVAATFAPTKAQAAPGTKTLIDLTETGILPTDQPDISCRSAYLIEANTGEVLYAKNADEDRYPASITKVLTALVVLENCNLSEKVTFSHASVTDLEDGGYDSRFKEGEVLTVEQCLYGMLLDSVNSCAYALAEHVAGSVPEFAVMMNQKATEIGCTNSNFENPHGLNNDKHRTTAHDMALILWNAMDNADFARIDGTVTYEIPATEKQPNGYKFTMHHKMMDPTGQYYYAAVKAGKTGYTSLAFHTLVTYAEKDGVKLVCVTMKGTDGSTQIYNDTKKLLDYGFEKFTMIDLSKLAENYLSGLNAISPVPVKMDTELSAYLPSDTSDARLEYSPTAGQAALGKLNLLCKGVVIKSKEIQVDTSLIEITKQETKSEDTEDTKEETGTSPFMVFLKVVLTFLAVIVVGTGFYWCYVQIIKWRRRKARLERAKRHARLKKMRENRE